jgi:ligand-binding sensor domain-containing protein
MTRSGTVTLLHSFDGTDGTSPFNALVQGTDGNLYGTTYYGGVQRSLHWWLRHGFQNHLAGTLSTLNSFSGTNGGYPQGGLLQGTNGDLYGATLEYASGGLRV